MTTRLYRILSSLYPIKKRCGPHITSKMYQNWIATERNDLQNRVAKKNHLVTSGHHRTPTQRTPYSFSGKSLKTTIYLHQVWMSPKWLPFLKKYPPGTFTRNFQGPNSKQLPRMGYLQSLASLENIGKYHFLRQLWSSMVVSASLIGGRWYIIIQLVISGWF